MTTHADSEFADLLASNARYARGFAMGDLPAPAARHIAVVTCIDSRIEPLRMLGLAPGDAKILRNAGARVTEDVLRSLVLATNFLDVSRVLLVGHTDCAAAGTPEAQLRAGLAAAHPGVDLGTRTFGGSDDPWATLEEDLALIDAEPLIPADVVTRAVCYDVRTGRLFSSREELAATTSP